MHNYMYAFFSRSRDKLFVTFDSYDVTVNIMLDLYLM